jgi:hypothetical protein
MAGPAKLLQHTAKPLDRRGFPEQLWHCRFKVRIRTSGTGPFLNAGHS